MTIGIGVAICLVALVIGAVVGAKMLGGKQSAAPAAEREKLVEAARAEAESLKHKAQLEAKEAALKATQEAERELKERRAELQRSESELRNVATGIDVHQPVGSCVVVGVGFCAVGVDGCAS